MPRQGVLLSCRSVLAAVGFVFIALPSAAGRDPLRPYPAALDGAPTELIDHLRADPFSYFRFINRSWTTRVCEVFAGTPDIPTVRLHGDAHVEQFALTKDDWGLDDFDDSARGPAVVDLVRFLGSIDLATRRLGWTRDRNRLWDRFLDGYRRGLTDSRFRPPEPDIVRILRQQAPATRAAYLAWGENLMQPMEPARLKSVTDAMAAFEAFLRSERPDLAPGYFAVVRAGWLRIGIGSAGIRKVLIRIQGATTDPADDQLIEAKEVTNLNGIDCLEHAAQQALRVVDGTRQLARLKHEILAIGPTMQLAAVERAEHWLDWCVSSWEPSYREVRLSDLRSVDDLSDIVFDSGVQLGAGKIPDVRAQALSSVISLDARLRRETSAIVEELLEGWREFAGR